jgi:hypothetical protein
LLPRLEFTANQFVNILDVLSFEFGIGNNRAEDSIMREKQLLIDFLCANAGGPLYYRGRDMQLSRRGLGISESDWNVFSQPCGCDTCGI